MNIKWTVWGVEGPSGKRYLLKAGLNNPIRQVLTVSQTLAALRRSRRQIYRYIADGAITAYGKYLGDWLVDKVDVERLKDAPAQAQPLPGSFQPFFPDYSVRDLNAGRDWTTVLSRLLEQGGRKEIGWVLRRYRKREIVRFLATDGARLLSPRTLNFCALYFKTQVPRLPTWRRHGWAYEGGV